MRKSIIKETLRLDQCEPGDAIRVPYSPNASWKSIGCVTLVKIKPLAKAGMVQVKFTPRFTRKPTVQKADIPSSIMVERERVTVDADGSGAGQPAPQVIEHDGIRYQILDPKGIDTINEVQAIRDSLPLQTSGTGPGGYLDVMADVPGFDHAIVHALYLSGARLERR